MRTLILPLVGLGLAAAVDSAPAASPAYCALYAREYANQMVEVGAPAAMAAGVQDQAYYRCLNQDEEPALPTASAYFGADIGDAAGGSPSTIPQGDISPEDEAAISADPAASAPEPPARAVTASSQSTGRRGDLVDWSSEWVAKCKKYYPNSFDPETGMVLPYSASKRRFCPY